MNDREPLVINAVIVAYNRPQSLCTLIASLVGQSYPVNRIVIVDNSTNNEVKDAIGILPGSAKALRPGEKVPDKITYIKMTENVGSAGGFYHAIKEAYQDCTHVWIFDDDMDVRHDSLENLLTVLPQLNADGKLGALRCWYHGNKETKPAAIDSFAWRGTLISSNVIRQVGLPDPGYFLYGEDVDYSLRIRKAGYSMYYVPQSIMWVNSSPTKVTGRFFGREVKFHQSPYRLYYAVRNELYLYSKFHDARGLIKSMGYVFKLLIIIMGMKNIKKGQFVKALMMGVIHYVIVKRGRNPAFPDKEDVMYCNSHPI